MCAAAEEPESRLLVSPSERLSSRLERASPTVFQAYSTGSKGHFIRKQSRCHSKEVERSFQQKSVVHFFVCLRETLSTRISSVYGTVLKHWNEALLLECTTGREDCACCWQNVLVHRVQGCCTQLQRKPLFYRLKLNVWGETIKTFLH